MSIWDTLKGHAKAQFLDVIQWMEDDRQTLVYRYPVFNQAIQDGGKVVVRPGQAAVFVNEGQLSEVFSEGTYEISSRTKAIMSFFESIKYQLNYPYKGDIFYVSTRQFIDQKWGTPQPVMLEDPKLGPVRIRAFGAYSFRIVKPDVFLRELVGNVGVYETKEITGQLKRKLVSGFVDTVGEANIPVLRLASQYMDLGEALCAKMTGWFEENYGVKLTDFVVENISLPPKVQEMLDKRTSMGLLGDMNQYQQFQAANAVEQMATRPGASNPMMDAGMGLAMGNMMGNMMGGGQQMGGQQMGGQPPAAPPPPPMTTFHYNGVGGQGQFSAQDIAQKIANNRNGAHNIWAQGWPGWRAWKDVPEIASLVPPPAAPAPAPSLPNPTFHYSGPAGQGEHPASAIADAVKAAPGERHLVWKQGFDGWKPAADVPEIQAHMNAGPPPLPGGGPPPPPPM
ncbi:MAG: SPFH domain-containing protein [Myxococcota bacterium]